MKRRWLIVIGALVFLGTAIARAPVASVYAWLAPSLAGSPVQFLGISGSLSEGQVAQVGYLGRPLVRELGWQLRPLWLLVGQFALQLKGGTEGLVVDGRANVRPTGTVGLGDFRLAGPVRPVLAAIGQPAPLDGQIGTELRSLTLGKDGWPEHADGTVTTQRLAWALGRDPVPLGDYEARLEDQAGGVKATISTLSGALEVTGVANLMADRTYELDLKMKPQPGAAPMVANLVGNLGQPDPQGYIHVKRKGTMSSPSASPALLPAHLRGGSPTLPTHDDTDDAPSNDEDAAPSSGPDE